MGHTDGPGHLVKAGLTPLPNQPERDQPCAQHVDAHAADRLFPAEVYGDNAVNQPDEGAGRKAHEQSRQRSARLRARPPR